MLARDEAERIQSSLKSVDGFADSVLVIDTGSTDETVAIAEAAGAIVAHHEWENFGANRTRALRSVENLACDWALMIDADMTVEAHPELATFLAEDEHPEVAAWQVNVLEATSSYKLPMLTRCGLEWRYVGAAHEYLDPVGRPQRPLLGLTLRHDRQPHPGRDEKMLAALMPGVETGEPRDTYYAAQTLWCLGRVEEAAALYNARAAMVGTFEEERWHAQYMAARLRDDVDGLIAAWRARPHRHEPLTWAARIVGTTTDDLLFLEAL